MVDRFLFAFVILIGFAILSLPVLAQGAAVGATTGSGMASPTSSMANPAGTASGNATSAMTDTTNGTNGNTSAMPGIDQAGGTTTIQNTAPRTTDSTANWNAENK